MTEPDLPPELADLERRVALRPPIDPPADLGPRVMDAVRGVIREPQRGGWTGWRFWAAVAASFLAVVNLSMSLATGTDWSFESPPMVNRPEHERQLQVLAPDLPDAEVRRQALLARAGAGLTPILIFTPNRESGRWDAR
jgi:hypothetical protein